MRDKGASDPGSLCVRVGERLPFLENDPRAVPILANGSLPNGARVRVHSRRLENSEMDIGRIYNGKLVAISRFHTAARPAPGVSIRTTDFRNFDYPPCDGPTLRLRNGKHRYGETVYDIAEFKTVRYVDFDGDGKQEAFVIVDWSSPARSAEG